MSKVIIKLRDGRELVFPHEEWDYRVTYVKYEGEFIVVVSPFQITNSFPKDLVQEVIVSPRN
jgi:hypothetical protein